MSRVLVKRGENFDMSDWRDTPGRQILDPRLGHRNGRNYPAGELYDPVWNTRWLGTDNFGFVYNESASRDFELSDKSFFRVFLLGGSTVMGLGVEDNAQTIASNLERFLKLRWKNARVVNCGTGSYMSWQQMSYLGLELIEYRPDFVVSLDGLNDFVHSTLMREWIPNTHPSLVEKVVPLILSTASFWDLAKRVIRKNTILATVASLVRHAQRELASLVDPSDNQQQSGRVSVRREAIEWYIRNVRSTIGIATFNGAKIVYLFQPQLIWGTRNPTTREREFLLDLKTQRPSISNLAAQWYAQARKEYCEVIANSHDSRTSWIEDASGWLDDVEETVYYDWCHYNKLGQRLIGERIGQVIVKMRDR